MYNSVMTLPSKNALCKNGFTLIELLVVIAIIALLIVMFVPNMAGILQSARTFQCQNNLKRIGEAVAQHKAIDRDRFEVKYWPMLVLPILDNQEEILICPEADEANIQSSYVPLVDQGQMHFATSGVTSPLDESPFVAKLSQTQIDAARAAGWLSESANNWCPPAYVADGTPYIYWLCYEDMLDGGDRDFEELQLKVTRAPGFVEIRFFRAGTGYGCWLEDYAVGTVRTLPAYSAGDDPVESADPYLFHAGGETTYGMNINVLDLEGGTDKILAVDYNKVVVDSIEDAWGIDPSFARHGGKMNVLYVDGSVKLKGVNKIDPIDPATESAYWLP